MRDEHDGAHKHVCPVERGVCQLARELRDIDWKGGGLLTEAFLLPKQRW